MAYASVNFPSKKAFKAAVAAGEKISLWSPGLGGPYDNRVAGVEGPWYPKPHRWYAEVRVADGVVISVK